MSTQDNEISDASFYDELVRQSEGVEIESYGDIYLFKFYDNKYVVTNRLQIEGRIFDNYKDAFESYLLEAECLYEFHKYEEQYNI